MSRYGIEHKKKRFFYFNVPLKERALQAEIARLKLVEEKYEEEMARKEKEVAEEIETERESALFKASAEILEEVIARKDMNMKSVVKKLQEKNSIIESLKKDLNDSKVDCEKVRSSQFNLIIREQALEARQLDLDNENARLKQVEEKYMADQARRSEEIEVCRDDVAEWQNNAHYTMRVLESKVKNRDEVIKDLKARYEASLEVNRLKAELNSCRDSADDGEDKKPLAKKPKK